MIAGIRLVSASAAPCLSRESADSTATESRRARRPALRESKNRGCIGETNQGLLAARPGEGPLEGG